MFYQGSTGNKVNLLKAYFETLIYGLGKYCKTRFKALNFFLVFTCGICVLKIETCQLRSGNLILKNSKLVKVLKGHLNLSLL